MKNKTLWLGIFAILVIIFILKNPVETQSTSCLPGADIVKYYNVASDAGEKTFDCNALNPYDDCKVQVARTTHHGTINDMYVYYKICGSSSCGNYVDKEIENTIVGTYYDVGYLSKGSYSSSIIKINEVDDYLGFNFDYSVKISYQECKTCMDECGYEGQKICDSTNSYYTCIMGSDGCLDKQVTTCPSGKTCENGQCGDYNIECSDSDGGKQYSIAGTVTSEFGSVGTDYCNGNQVCEYYCSGTNGALECKDCGIVGGVGYSCKQGTNGGYCYKACTGATKTVCIDANTLAQVYVACPSTIVDGSEQDCPGFCDFNTNTCKQGQMQCELGQYKCMEDVRYRCVATEDGFTQWLPTNDACLPEEKGCIAFMKDLLGDSVPCNYHMYIIIGAILFVFMMLMMMMSGGRK